MPFQRAYSADCETRRSSQYLAQLLRSAGVEPPERAMGELGELAEGGFGGTVVAL